MTGLSETEYVARFGPFEMPSRSDFAMQVAPDSIFYYSARSLFHGSSRLDEAMVSLRDIGILPDDLLPLRIQRFHHDIHTIGWNSWTDKAMNAHAEVGDLLYQWMKFVLSDDETVVRLRSAFSKDKKVELYGIVHTAIEGNRGHYLHELLDRKVDGRVSTLFVNAMIDREARGVEPVTDRAAIWRKLLTFREVKDTGQVGELQELLTACLALQRVERNHARINELYLAVHELIGFFENQGQFHADAQNEDAFFSMLSNASTYLSSVLDALPGVSRGSLFEFVVEKQRLRMDIGKNARRVLKDTSIDTRAVTKGITALYEPYLVWRYMTRFYELLEE